MTCRYCILGAVLLALLAFVPPVEAAVDTPTLEIGISGHGKQVVVVTAGPSGLPNGFALWWMDHSTYASYNYQWPETVVAGMGYATFTGTPTLNTFGGMYSSFQLGPNESITIEVGDLHDESGVNGTTDELVYGEEYYFCAFGVDANGDRDGSLSATLQATTTLSTDCTYTVGYWKTHPEMWPVLSLDLGGVTYTKQELLDILNQPVQGNGLISLAHQLIAAKLNVANGADPSASATAIADAAALIGSLVVPPVGTGYLAPSSTSMTTQSLDDYNNGVTGPGHCGIVPTQKTSWGALKTLYGE